MDDFDVDPEIAAAMGFAGFGTQSKKRKYDNDDAFVDPSATSSGPAKSKGNGANSLPLGKRMADRTGDKVQSTEAVSDTRKPEATLGAGTEETQLQALRHGVKNATGDMVFFLPSFIEDPWKGLEAR